MAFLTLTIARLFHCFNCRNDKPISKIKLLSNKFSVMAFVAGLIFIGGVIVITPLSGLFDIANIGVRNLVFAITLAFAPTALIQLYKMVLYKGRNEK